MQDRHQNLTKEQADELAKALAVIGYIEVEYNGYLDHVDDADAMFLFNPTTKKGLSIWISDPDDQLIFDEYYMSDVEKQFNIEVFKKRKK